MPWRSWSQTVSPKAETVRYLLDTSALLAHYRQEAGRVIGFEKLNFVVPTTEHLRVAFEAVGA